MIIRAIIIVLCIGILIFLIRDMGRDLNESEHLFTHLNHDHDEEED